jgi:rsbT co-antagonist protein RsbR
MDVTLSTFHALLQALPDPAALLEPDGAVVAANAAWGGLSPDTASGEASPSSALRAGAPFLEQLAAMLSGGAAEALEALAEAVRAVAAASRARADIDYPYELRGEPRCLRLTLSRFHLGEASGALIQARDVTELFSLRRAEAERRDAHERLQLLCDVTRESVFLTERGRVVDANAAALQTFGYTAEQLRGLSGLEIVAPESRDLVNDRMTGNVPGVYEAVLLRGDGSKFDAEISGTVVQYQGRRVRGTVIRDITERKNAERATRDSEQRFRLLADLTSEAIVLTDGGVLFDANAAMLKMLGYTKEELVGRPALEFIAAESHERVRQALLSGSEEPYEIAAMRKDKTRFPALVLGRALPFQGRSVRGTIIRDLTLERQAQAALRQSIAQEETLRAQAAALAELSTPLIPINDFIMVMPLIGAIDGQRAARVVEALLRGIQERGARIAILDITGVPSVDAQVASALMQAARAVRLIGASVVLTGIRPEVAQTLVTLGVDLSGITTRGTLQSGIGFAMARYQG